MADDPTQQPEVSVVVESYTHSEGSDLDRVTQALRAAVAMVDEHGAGEVLVADSSADPALAELLARLGPEAEIARELSYRLYVLAERKKRSDEALWYNGLVQAWPEVTGGASGAGQPTVPPGWPTGGEP